MFTNLPSGNLRPLTGRGGVVVGYRGAVGTGEGWRGLVSAWVIIGVHFIKSSCAMPKVYF